MEQWILGLKILDSQTTNIGWLNLKLQIKILMY